MAVAVMNGKQKLQDQCNECDTKGCKKSRWWKLEENICKKFNGWNNSENKNEVSWVGVEVVLTNIDISVWHIEQESQRGNVKKIKEKSSSKTSYNSSKTNTINESRTEDEAKEPSGVQRLAT